MGWIDPQAGWLGNDVHGLSIALIGMGRIGRAFASMAGMGFGARVIAYDPFVTADQMRVAGVEKFDCLHTMLAQADVVSLHSVLNSETHCLLGEREFACMTRQPVFINVSRGALVDERALVSALDSGQIRAAGLDVYSQEPLNRHTHPLASLYERDNVILMPHLTFYTQEAMRRLTRETLERSQELLDGRPVTIRSADPRLLAQSGSINVQVDDSADNKVK